MIAPVEDYIDALTNSFSASPVMLGVVMGLVLLIMWAKWRFIHWVTQRSLRGSYSGWVHAGGVEHRPHETGIGTTERQVMRPKGHFRIGLLTLLLFGGGAWFYAAIVLPETDEPLKDWAVFTTMSGFGFVSIGLIYMSFTRIRYDDTQIERRRLFQPARMARWRDLQTIKPLGQTVIGGVRLHFEDGTVIKIAADMTGYHQLMKKLSAIDPRIAMVTRMAERRLQQQV